MYKAVATEQREHARFAPTVLRSDAEWESQRAQGYLMNLSLGGAFLALSDPPPPETRVTLHVLLPWGLGECALEARCVWAQEDHRGRAVGAGVAFEELPEEARKKLQGYLDRYAELAAEITD
jgi:uncharacterized protein (TIGR02266 family)